VVTETKNEELECFIGMSAGEAIACLEDVGVSYRIWDENNKRHTMEVVSTRVNLFLNSIGVVEKVGYG